MKDKFQGILIASDLDGTLIGDGAKIPQRNIEAIEYFKSLGGKFTIATGRTIESTRRYVDIVKPNAPCIVFNGAMIYDYESEHAIWQTPIDERAKSYTKDIMDKFPEIGVEVCTEGPINIIRKTPLVMDHVGIENMSYCETDLDSISKTWYKVFFAIESDLMAEVENYAKSLNHEGVWYVASSANYFEMLPVGTNKGNGLKKLTKYLNLDDKDVYAIGDYYNDLEMLSSAATSVTPKNAPEDIKSSVSKVVCHCNEGAIGNLIQIIEQKIINNFH